jgi:cell division septation protein DedD
MLCIQAAQSVVLAAITAVADAVIRCPATDKVSIITLVLNGTEVFARREQKDEEKGTEAPPSADVPVAPTPTDVPVAPAPPAATAPPTGGDATGTAAAGGTAAAATPAPPPQRAFNVQPQYFLSLKDGKGNDFAELTQRMNLMEPELVLARAGILEYFNAQET